VPRLLRAGYRVRCLVRDASRLQGRSWLGDVEVVEGNVLDAAGLPAAMAGVDVAYYLVHSMSSAATADYAEVDLQAARTFATAAKVAGVQRLIYLGGLGDPTANLSPHLRSRQETGAALQEGGVPVTEFRAAVIVGAGSISFDMMRYLTERLPVMICPRWLGTRVQPISVENVLDYLVGALTAPSSAARIVEIGGADVLTYGEMIMRYAQLRGLRRKLISVPVLTPRLSSYWVHLVTPIPTSIARPLIDGLSSEVVVHGTMARSVFPQIHPVDYRTAVQEALASVRMGAIESVWTDALASSQGRRQERAVAGDAGVLSTGRQRLVKAPPPSVFAAFAGIGGKRGYGSFDWAWRLRGTVDRFFGGVGLRRGRRDPDSVRVGDALDFWRVEAVVPNVLLRLHAEMKLPGSAWLQFEAVPREQGALLLQTAFFSPRGVAGLLYWYLLYPIHGLVFSGMIRKLAARAEANTVAVGPGR
jgi:uncharacterized protein YbjT (DUF2867 family)